MELKKALCEEFRKLEELLDELEAGQATWDEYGPALHHIGAYVGTVNAPLSELVHTTVARLTDSGGCRRVLHVSASFRRSREC